MTSLLMKTSGAVMILVAMLAVTLSTPGLARSQSPIAFGIAPANTSPTDAGSGAYFVYQAERGSTVSDEALITTTSQDPLKLTVYAADAVTASGGGTAFAQPGQNVSGERAWLRASVESVSVTATQPATVAFSLAIPPDAAAGDHVIGLIVEAAPRAGASGGGVQTTVTERAGVAVVIRVPGQLVERLTLGNFCLNTSRGSNYLEIPVFNEGNILTRGTGTFRLETNGGQHVFERPVELQTVMAPGATMLRVFPPQVIPPGKYRASMEVNPAGGSATALKVMTVEYTSRELNTCELIAPDSVPGDFDTSRDNFAIGGSSGPGVGVWLIGGLLAIVAILLAAVVVVMLANRRRASVGA